MGVLFAPHHQDSADELVRVVRPGGTIGLISWTPAGFIGQMLTVMTRYLPAPPAGVQPPLWGDEQHVRGLLRDRVSELSARRETVRVEFDRPEDFRDFFKTNSGPTIVAFRGLSDDPDRVAALDAELVDLARRFDEGTGTTVMAWEYLLVVARTRD